MSFVSLEFLVFFAIVVPLYFALPLRWRWVLLLISSYIFYAFSEVVYVLLMGFTTLVDYFASRGIAATPKEQVTKRRLFLATSLVLNFGLLFFFKYFNFFNTSVDTLLGAVGIPYEPFLHNLILPVGISFYTFQSISYTIDVYRGSIPAEKNAGIMATYVAFFPQLVAGPIERASNIIPQFSEKYDFDYNRIVSGLRLVLWGAFKKIVIADRLAIYVNQVYNHPNEYSGLILWLATFFFAFQIYCDFSGYSDIAIGAARVMGFKLMENFRQPYLSRSVREFWRRWHISLSTWFRDYLYIPLGGNRVSFTRNLINLMIVFVVSGLWHGASWTFVIWGALHGFYIVVETLYQQWQGRPKIAENGVLVMGQRLLTFALVLLAWLFFRSNTMSDAQYVLTHLWDFQGGLQQITQPFAAGFLGTRNEFILAFILIAVLLCTDSLQAQKKSETVFALLTWTPLRWLAYYGVATLVLGTWLLYTSTAPTFIYFQF